MVRFSGAVVLVWPFGAGRLVWGKCRGPKPYSLKHVEELSYVFVPPVGSIVLYHPYWQW